MSDPKWLEELEEKARAATQDEKRWQCRPIYIESNMIGLGILQTHNRTAYIEYGSAHHIEANSPAHVLALCKLVREMGDSIGSRFLDCEKCPEIGNCEDCMLAEKAWHAYQRGPVIEENKG